MHVNRTATFLIILGLLAIPRVSLAQATDPIATGMWAGVKNLPPGEKLVVKLKEGRQLKGRVTSVSDTGLTLLRRNKTMEVDRDSVQQIFRLTPKSARKATLIGAGVGLGVAAGITGAVCTREGAHTGECWGWGMLLVGGAGAGLGALVGMAGASRQESVLIYDAEVLNSLSRPSPHKKVPAPPRINTAHLADLPYPSSDENTGSSPYPTKEERSQRKEAK